MSSILKSKKAPRSARAESFIRSRPWLSLGAVGAVVGIITALLPLLTSMLGHFQTADEAKSESRKNAQRDAWAAYSIADLKASIFENRVYECAKERSRAKPTPAEIAICEQFSRNYEAANAARQRAYAEALAYGKEK